MDYKEFRNAAHRHLVSCQKMCERLSQISNKNDRRDMIADIYYLSGYVIETLLSYAIFSVASRDIQRRPIEEHPQYEEGFKTHNYQAKIDFAIKHNCSFDGMLLISKRHQNKDICRMYNGWQVEMRYQHPSKFANVPSDISTELITAYVSELSKLESEFNRRFI